MASDKKNISLLTDIFVKKGLSDIVISPGSRNAPIILAFTNRPEIAALSVVDERSAAFFALGMAQQLGKAVAVACTSGSAALNYAPAIAEAYYQKIPLLVLTADRPPELIENGDGQTIRQKNVFANYIKASFELAADIETAEQFAAAEKLINQAIDATMFPEAGPVHINVPFREPLYNVVDEHIHGAVQDFREKLKPIPENLLQKFAKKFNSSSKVLLITGQGQRNEKLNGLLAKIAQLSQVAVLTETTSNLHNEHFIDCIDNVVSTINESESNTFQPGLIISFGGQVVSKMIKSFLRKNKAAEHWHISPSGEKMDTYFCLAETIVQDPVQVFTFLGPLLENKNSDFSAAWKNRKKLVTEKRAEYLQTIPYSDFQVFDFLLKNIPTGSNLHLGNSTPVRYSQLFGSSERFTYFSNRGVSGIDGQVSTTAGAAFISSKINTIITGDLGFFYDSNALMNHYLKPNLKIIVINNGGGGIFRFIDGPASTPQLEKFFEAKHNWKAEKIAECFGLNYFKSDNFEQLKQILPEFYKQKNKQSSLLELFTPAETNALVLKDYFKFLKPGP